MKQILEYAVKYKLIKIDNRILENSVLEKESEDRTMWIITKEFTDFILRLIKS